MSKFTKNKWTVMKVISPHPEWDDDDSDTHFEIAHFDIKQDAEDAAKELGASNGDATHRAYRHYVKPATARLRFGSRVLIRRGWHTTPPPGQLREVKATYIGAKGNWVLCRLEQDDPLANVGWKKKGDTGWWSKSIMRLDPEVHTS